MRPGPLLALLLLLAAGASFAQSAPRPSTPPLVELPGASEAPPEAPREALPAQSDRPSRVPRIAVETLAGVGLGVVAGFVSNELVNSSFIYLGAPVGLALGIVSAGYVMDGNGNPFVVLAAELGGMLAGYFIGTFLIANTSNGYDYSPMLLTMGITTVVAGVAGYELSSVDSRSALENAASAQARGRTPGFAFMPFAAPTRSGPGGIIGFSLRL
jgi:hypothetical protein